MSMGDAMRMTPLDIQQMVFKVSFRGYDKEEVNRFLEELAQTVESSNRDNAVQREKILFLEQQLAELKAGELIRQARVELTDTQRELSSLQKQRLLMIERLRASLRMFERLFEVEEQEAFHDAETASEQKLEGESSPAL